MTAPQRSPEWFTARKGRVTGSLCGAILGLSPNMSRDDALRLMVRDYHGAERETTDFVENVIFAHGKTFEETAIRDYELETQQETEECGFFEFEDWLGASPDRLVGKRGLLEVKAPWSKKKHEKPEFKKLSEQPHYAAQCQIEMFCARKDWLHFFQYTPHGFKLEMVEPDGDWLAENLPRLKQFHAEFLDACATPETYLEPERVTVDTPDAHKMVKEWDELSEAISRAEERKKDLLAEMVALAGERDALIASRKLTLTERAGSVSYAKALKAAAPGFDVEPFRGVPSKFWGLR